MADQVFSNNLSKYLRMAHLFGASSDDDMNSGNDPISFGMPEDDNNDNFDPVNRMRELYHPETRMTEQYNTALSEMPQRNHPGILRKLAATAAAFNSPQAVEHTLYAPYQRELTDWKTKLGPLEQGASLEKQNNSNQRMVANQILSQEMGDRRLTRQIGRDKTLERQGDERIKATEGRYKTLEEQANKRIAQADERTKIAQAISKGGIFNVDDAGNARMLFKDGSSIPIRGEYLSAEEKSALREHEAAARTRASEGAKRDRIVEKTIEYPEGSGKMVRGTLNLDTNEFTPSTVNAPKNNSTASVPQTPGNEAKGVDNRALQAKNSNPEWSKFIEFSKSGRFTRIKPPGFFSGPSKEQYEQIHQAIYGTNSPNNNSVSTPNNATGRVRVIGPNGERGTVSSEESKSLPNGWRTQ